MEIALGWRTSPPSYPAPDTFYTVKKGICRLEQTNSRAADAFFLLYCVSFGYWKNSVFTSSGSSIMPDSSMKSAVFWKPARSSSLTSREKS